MRRTVVLSAALAGAAPAAWGLTITCKAGPVLVPAAATACQATPALSEVVFVDDPALNPDLDCAFVAPTPPFPGLATTSVAVRCVGGAGSAEAVCPVTVVDINPPSIACPNVNLACGGTLGDPPAGASACWTVETVCALADGTPWDESMPPSADTTYTCTARISGRSGELVNTAQCTGNLTVVPAELSLQADPLPGPVPLWPPNHKYVEVDIGSQCLGPVWLVNNCTGVRTPVDEGSLTASVIRITSTEAEDDKLDSGGERGDGHTCLDLRLVTPSTFGLRRERNGSGDGRVYRVLYEVAHSPSGLTTQSACSFSVPHSLNRAAAPSTDCRFCVGEGCGSCPGPDPSCSR